MQFLLIAFDGIDPDAPERRKKVRPEHLNNVARQKKQGEFLSGGAILDDNGMMIGSMIVYEFHDRSALDESLKTEPYITGEVWKKIDIRPFRLAGIEIK